LPSCAALGILPSAAIIWICRRDKPVISLMRETFTRSDIGHLLLALQVDDGGLGDGEAHGFPAFRLRFFLGRTRTSLNVSARHGGPSFAAYSSALSRHQ
jgi:hypothetical protein